MDTPCDFSHLCTNYGNLTPGSCGTGSQSPKKHSEERGADLIYKEQHIARLGDFFLFQKTAFSKFSISYTTYKSLHLGMEDYIKSKNLLLAHLTGDF